MTFLQGQWDDDCYTPWNSWNLYNNRSYDCWSPCGYRGYGGLYGYRGLYGFGDRYGYGGLYGNRGIYGSGDCSGYPSFYSGRYSYPFGSRYGQRFGCGNWYSW